MSSFAGKFKQKLNSIGCGLCLIVGTVLVVTIVVITQVQNARAAAPFKGMKDEMQALGFHCSGYAYSTVEPQRVGRVLVVDSDGRAIGRVMARTKLNGIVATSPEEVGSVLLVSDAEKTQMGTYSDGAKAFHISREVCLIDLESGDVIYRGLLMGSTPPSSKSGGGSATGSDPLPDEVLDFIAALTER